MSTETPNFRVLPQTGWVLDSYLAESIGVTRQTLRDWIRKYSLPAKELGNTILIQMETFYACLPPLQFETEEDRPNGKEKKRPRT